MGRLILTLASKASQIDKWKGGGIPLFFVYHESGDTYRKDSKEAGHKACNEVVSNGKIKYCALWA